MNRKTCPNCGEQFPARGVQKYCSPRCRKQANNGRPSPYSCHVRNLIEDHPIPDPSPEWEAAHEARIEQETQRVQADLARLERSTQG